MRGLEEFLGAGGACRGRRAPAPPPQSLGYPLERGESSRLSHPPGHSALRFQALACRSCNVAEAPLQRCTIRRVFQGPNLKSVAFELLSVPAFKLSCTHLAQRWRFGSENYVRRVLHARRSRPEETQTFTLVTAETKVGAAFRSAGARATDFRRR